MLTSCSESRDSRLEAQQQMSGLFVFFCFVLKYALKSMPLSLPKCFVTVSHRGPQEKDYIFFCLTTYRDLAKNLPVISCSSLVILQVVHSKFMQVWCTFVSEMN